MDRIMNAVIVGCGKVGTELAKTLVNDGHDVTVIDNDEKALEQAAEAIDILPICGNGADINTLKEADLKSKDIFIAVSPSDELNLLSCVIAGSISTAKTIARVRNPLYSKETEFLKNKLGLSKIINPEHAAALEIYKLLQYPALTRMDSFANGKVVIFTVHITSEHPLLGKSLQEVRGITGSNILVCAVERKGEVIIPSGNFVIEDDDAISIVSTLDEMKNLFRFLKVKNKAAQSCIITGGGTIAHYLTDMLLKKGMHVRIVEINEDKCQKLSEVFPEAEVIHGDGTDKAFLMKQGLGKVDAFVPLTGIDEENIITATFAKNVSDAKVITKISRTDLNDVMDELHIDSAVFPKFICADIIAQYVRAQSNGVGGNVETLYRYLDNRIEILEFKAKDDKDIVNIPLALLGVRLKDNMIIACIVRDGSFIIPSGKNMIKEHDSVIIVTTHHGISALHGILK